jgi:hypothetical protein
VCRKLRQFHPFHQFRAGVVVASSQIAHASETLMRVGLWRRDDVGAARMAAQLSIATAKWFASCRALVSALRQPPRNPVVFAAPLPAPNQRPKLPCPPSRVNL